MSKRILYFIFLLTSLISSIVTVYLGYLILAMLLLGAGFYFLLNLIKLGLPGRKVKSNTTTVITYDADEIEIPVDMKELYKLYLLFIFGFLILIPWRYLEGGFDKGFPWDVFIIISPFELMAITAFGFEYLKSPQKVKLSRYELLLFFKSETMRIPWGEVDLKNILGGYVFRSIYKTDGRYLASVSSNIIRYMRETKYLFKSEEIRGR